MAVASKAQAAPLSNILHELSVNPTLLAEYKQNPIAVAKNFSLSDEELKVIAESSNATFAKKYANMSFVINEIQTHHHFE